MPSFVNKKLKNGKTRIKALARVWVDGKQVTRSKSFDCLDKAEEWAFDQENKMKQQKIHHLYGIKSEVDQIKNQIPNSKVKLPQVDCNEIGITISDVFELQRSILDRIEKHLGKINPIFLKATDLIDYFVLRSKEQATQDEIDEEIQLLRDLIILDNPESKRSKIVMSAYNLAIAERAEFI